MLSTLATKTYVQEQNQNQNQRSSQLEPEPGSKPASQSPSQSAEPTRQENKTRARARARASKHVPQSAHPFDSAHYPLPSSSNRPGRRAQLCCAVPLQRGQLQRMGKEAHQKDTSFSTPSMKETSAVRLVRHP